MTGNSIFGLERMFGCGIVYEYIKNCDTIWKLVLCDKILKTKSSQNNMLITRLPTIIFSVSYV